jgi:hypothetical protein
VGGGGGGGACEEEELPSKQTDSKSQKCCNSNKNPSTRIPSKQGVWPCHLHKKVLGQKKNSGNSKYFTMQKNNLQKNPLKETKILQDIL